MKVSLTKGMEKDEAEEFEQMFKESKRLREALVRTLTNEVKVSHEDSLKTTAYTNSAWPYKQAESNGYRRALNKLISLLE